MIMLPGKMIHVVTTTRPVSIETLEASVSWKIFLATESLTPSSKHVAGVAEAGEVLGQYLHIQGETNRFQVVR